MALHGGAWRVHASAVDDVELIADSIKWLCGGDEGIMVKRGKSALGAPMYTIECKMKPRIAMHSLERINSESLSSMLDFGLASQIDNDKILHIRIDLDSLVRGEAIVVRNNLGPVAKGRFKLEVYPGQDPASVAERLIEKLV